MLEILVVVIAMLVMARKGRGRGKRSMGRYIRGNVDENLALGTLAAATLVGVLFDETVNERTYVSSIVATWNLSDFTEAADVGPIVVGIAHGDYSDAEIEAFIENTGSWNEGDLVQQREVGRRLIRKVGTFGADGPVDSATSLTLNDGKPITTKLGWILLQGQTLRYWAYNPGAAAVSTTDPNVRLSGHVNLWPR